MVQPFLDAEVGKDGLNDGETSGIDLLALGCINPSLHVFEQVG